MNMQDALYWWTGCVVWSVIELAALWLAIEILIGVAMAISWCRWSYRLMTTHARKPQWRHLPKAFCSRWLELVGHRNKGDLTWSGEGGYWKGIGDWKVWPATLEPEQSPAHTPHANLFRSGT